MTRYFLLIFPVILIFLSCKREWDNPYDEPGNWVKLYDFEGLGREGAVGFVIDNKAYIGLGYNDETNEKYLNDFWVFDYQSCQWKIIAYFPGGSRTGAVAFSLNGKGYVGTGFDGVKCLKDLWEYDPRTNKWTQKDDFPGQARCDAVGFSLLGYGYIGTGKSEDDGFLIEFINFYRFDPTAATGTQWIKVQSICGAKRNGAAAFTYNDVAYVCTGTSNRRLQTDMYAYDPEKDEWTRKADLKDQRGSSFARQGASSFVLNGKAYVLLGESSGTLNDVWEYDFEKDVWKIKSDFEGTVRKNAVAFTFGERAFVGTGKVKEYYLDDFWEYRPLEKYNDED